MLLIETTDDIGSDAEERTQCRGRPDAVLASAPCRVEDLRHLLQIIHEELLRFLPERVPLAPGAESFSGKQLLQLLRERGLGDPAPADTQQLDLAVEWRVLPVVQRQQAVLPVDGAQDAFALGHFERADRRA